MIKAALFDLDGVVFETESQYSIFWGMIGREYHPEIPDFEYLSLIHISEPTRLA